MRAMAPGVFALCFGLFGCGASTAGGSLSPSVAAAQPQLVDATSRSRARPTPTPDPTTVAIGNAAPSICVAGTLYGIAQDDEFAADATLSTSPGAVPIAQALSPKITWSTQFNWGGGAFSSNGGTDDAYYEDPTLKPALNPFTLANGALGITASPLATPTTPPDGYTRHWGSGELTGPPITYGYFEIAAKLPSLQGFWPALWLHPANGDAFLKSATAAEYDLAEIFGNAYPSGTVQQTAISSYSPSIAKYVQTAVPTAATAYHTYGLLWTPSGVNYYIDRVARTPVWPNLTNGPESIQLTLQVFAPGTWAPAPASTTPQTMYLTYYRAYQATPTSCSPSVVPAASH